MIDIQIGTLLASAVQQAQEAMETGEYQQAAISYQQALTRLTDTSTPIVVQRALWVEHVGGLLRHEQLSEATAYAKEYIAFAQESGDKQAELRLQVLFGEALAAQDKWHNCRRILATIMSELDKRPGLDRLLGDQRPHLIRLQALEVEQQGNFALAELLLHEAADAFAIANNPFGQRTVTNDLRRLGLLAGNVAIVNEVLSIENIQSTYELLLLARALRRDARYETALRLLMNRLDYDVEPALRYPLLHELVLLYQTLADREMVQRLLPLLREAVSDAAEPNEAYAAVKRLCDWQEEGFTISQGTGFEARLHNVRALIQNENLAQAEKVLKQLRSEAKTPRLSAYWSLIAGELEFALGLRRASHQVDQRKQVAQQALGHLERAVKLAVNSSLPNVCAQATRLTGRVYAWLLNDLDMASDYWSQANRIEETIAHRQETDQVRIRYLEALPTQYDELMRATTARIMSDKEALAPRESVPIDGELVAGVIATMEAARGAAILSQILPLASKMRELPSPSNPTACLVWYTELTERLPKNMAIWILHTTPDQLHHGLLGRDLLNWVKVATNRHDLNEAIEELKDAWDNPQTLERMLRQSPEWMLERLKEIAQLLRVDLALARLPKRITRLAIVAGDALGDIPFAALPLLEKDSPKTPLITRYALSNLPCLSMYYPLKQRAVSTRGDDGLAIHPDASKITISEEVDSLYFKWLTNEEATITTLDRELDTGDFPLVWINCHGHYQDERALDSYLRLAKESENDGHLTARRFQKLSLKRCGTLILGACESGMSHRLGRDERIGFVRAGFAAGAPAILAARWIATELVAAVILGRFLRYLRYLPRDQALQRAQLDVIEGRCQELFTSGQPLPSGPEHPAYWACWTLYGDAGLQTSAGWLRRTIRRFVARWRSFKDSLLAQA